MACYHKITAYRSLIKKTRYGKPAIVFDPDQAGGGPPVVLACGQCIGCRIAQARQWALRCIHEASLYGDHNSVVTLTYNDKSLPPGGTLRKADAQQFMRRLRRRFSGVVKVNGERPIRFFLCGEYGDQLSRPHYHVMLFNHEFSEMEFWRKTDAGSLLYRDPCLEGEDGLWPHGHSEIGEMSVETAAYISGYCVKKITGSDAACHYLAGDPDTGEAYYLEPEFINMSRRPGIGKGWFDKFGSSDVWPKDFITRSGKVYSVPKYYDKLLDAISPEEMAAIKAERRRKAEQEEKMSMKREMQRLRAKEIQQKHNFRRSFEHGD